MSSELYLAENCVEDIIEKEKIENEINTSKSQYMTECIF